MLSIEPLGLSANHWQFLSAPDRYVEESKCLDRPLVLESTRRQFLTAHDILARLNGTQGEKRAGESFSRMTSASARQPSLLWSRGWSRRPAGSAECESWRRTM